MTDGRLFYDGGGERYKVFHVRDGLGLKLAQRAGLQVGILSGRENQALANRAEELGIDCVILDRTDKGQAFAEFLAERRTAPERVGYLGDDLVDLPVILRCGLSFATHDAVPEVCARVDWILELSGGHGAVREMCEVVLKARGDWERVVLPFLSDGTGGGPPG
jgi:3-deoxy-D-manno-octulosonate 8-phosphate phosphatase (KDO 8-P phosphatase)